MKVFISHKDADANHAKTVYTILRNRGISAYLDSLDTGISTQSKGNLREYIMAQMADCTHVIPVLTEKTEKSWWVPFEVGVGAEKGRAIATYSPTSVSIPEILLGWPYLQTTKDIEVYVEVALSETQNFKEEALEKKSLSERRGVAKGFEQQLRRKLGQF